VDVLLQVALIFAGVLGVVGLLAEEPEGDTLGADALAHAPEAEKEVAV
jgi:hypothetical protein